MIGSAMMRAMHAKFPLTTWGTIRDSSFQRYFEPDIAEHLIPGIGVENIDALAKVLGERAPDVVINCAGLTKHKDGADDPLIAVPINTIFPHRLARLCGLIDARLIHISTDCVFSGSGGMYKESDFADASDVYGRSKILGEVAYGNNVTLRTSTIGRELNSKFGLLEWFLAQQGSCKGYKNAIFSGFPTSYFATVVRDIVLPNSNIRGLYHVSADPISKFDLLSMIAMEYSKKIDIVSEEDFCIDRSLDSTAFKKLTGFQSPDWKTLIQTMRTCE